MSVLDIADRNAEASIVGGISFRPGTIDELQRLVTPEDFTSPTLALLYRAAVDLRLGGQTVDAVTIVDRATHLSGTYDVEHLAGAMLTAQASMATTVGELRTHAGIVVDLAVRRAVIIAADAAKKAAEDYTEEDPLGVARTALEEVTRPLTGPPEGLTTSAALAAIDPGPQDWLIPSILGVADRLLLVGPEGAGKSVVLRQVSVLAAAGIHPFTRSRITPVPTLLVDLENPERTLAEGMRHLHRYLTHHAPDHHAHVWPRPGGLDLRSRRDQLALEAAVAYHRPRLVVLGPLYKAYTVKARESDELAAGEVQTFLDGLRTRYGLAVVLEHHAPKAQGGRREWTPYGSSVWLRWPEYGRTVAVASPEDCKRGGRAGESLVVGKFRGDRQPVHWPGRLDRGGIGDAPWVAVYPDGMYPEDF